MENDSNARPRRGMPLQEALRYYFLNPYFRDAFDFKGSMSRERYWLGVLASAAFCSLIGWLYLILMSLIQTGAVRNSLVILSILLYIYLFIAGTAAAVRRLHDTGRKGACFLLVLIPIVGPIWLIVLLCRKISGAVSYEEPDEIVRKGTKGMIVSTVLMLAILNPCISITYWNMPSVQNQMGTIYYRQGDYARAVPCFRKAADKGGESAQYNLGVCFYNGQGVVQDYSQAVMWFRMSAEQGYAQAENDLGVCYYNGLGVSQDLDEAAYWWNRAVSHGNGMAEYNLKLLSE